MRTTVILMLAIATVTGCSRSPSDREPTQTAHTDAQAECLLNLSLLHRTTEICALAGNLSVEEQIDPKTFAAYFYADNDSGSTNCPSRGVYSFGVVGTKPECSIHGKLPRRSRTENPPE
jgi:hypothetical protein